MVAIFRGISVFHSAKPSYATPMPSVSDSGQRHARPIGPAREASLDEEQQVLAHKDDGY
ncbi:hypothetical protein LY76DRAFT_418536 [Colletotrichum caudatum]|nr:hypothetical protein LY76DRAFT_418536 [Colletotrichum caudatum]